MDQKIQFYSVKASSRKWTMVVFSYLLDTVRVNSTTLFAINKKLDPKKCNAFNYTFNVAERLVVLQMKRKKRVSLLSNIIKKY